MTTIHLIRAPQEADATFGKLTCNNYSCFSMERNSVIIPSGTYDVTLELSPHFGFITPHLDVPGRTYIEIHPANFPSQLEGCIAVGKMIDGDALDNSREAFDGLMEQLTSTDKINIIIG